MFEPRLPGSVDQIRFDDPEFWNAPAEDREGAFALLLARAPMSFHEEFTPPPEIPLPKGPGYWSVTRMADVLTASRTVGIPGWMAPWMHRFSQMTSSVCSLPCQVVN